MRAAHLLAAFVSLTGCPQVQSGSADSGTTNDIVDAQGDVAVSDGAFPIDGGIDGIERHLSAGTSHVCVVRSGVVTCAGSIVAGAIGFDPSGRPRTVHVPGEVRSLSSALETSCALTRTGDVYCWGEGSLGLGTEMTRVAEPERMTLSGVSQITGGIGHCALSGSGVTCWGVLPVASASGAATQPEIIEGTADVISIAAGGGFHCLVGSDHRVRCRGTNTRGQCGASPSTSAPLTQVEGLNDVLTVRAGGASACARQSTGRVACWGSNQFGTLGDGTQTDHSTPAEVRGIDRIAQIELAGVNACAKTDGGAVWCWGSRQAGLLGDGVRVQDEADSRFVQPSPVRVEAWTDVVEVAVGIYLACALRGDQSVWCWGWNNRVALPWPNGTVSPPVRVIPPP